MNSEKVNKEPEVSRIIRQERHNPASTIQDYRDYAAMQTGLAESIQRSAEDEEELLQGKFEPRQLAIDDEEELVQGKFESIQKESEANHTGIPDAVKSKMENSFGTDFSEVRVHPDSSKAPEVGALAYTQGTDIHFAPGQFKPDSTSGQQLLGHELTHVVQQAQGRVQPTTEINGMPVNDNDSLENEADLLGSKSASAG